MYVHNLPLGEADAAERSESTRWEAVSRTAGKKDEEE